MAGRALVPARPGRCGAGMAIAEIAIFSATLPAELRLLSALAFGIFGGMVPAAALGSVATYTPSPAQIGTMNGLMVMGTNTGQLFGPPALAASIQLIAPLPEISCLLGLNKSVALIGNIRSHR